MILVHSIPSHGELGFLSFPVGSSTAISSLLVTGDFNGCIKNGEPIIRILFKSCLYLSLVTLPLFIYFSSELFSAYFLCTTKKLYRLTSSQDQMTCLILYPHFDYCINPYPSARILGSMA